MVGWHHWLDGPEFQQGNWWWTGKPGMLQTMESKRGWTQLSNWTEPQFFVDGDRLLTEWAIYYQNHGCVCVCVTVRIMGVCVCVCVCVCVQFTCSIQLKGMKALIKPHWRQTGLMKSNLSPILIYPFHLPKSKVSSSKNTQENRNVFSIWETKPFLISFHLFKVGGSFSQCKRKAGNIPNKCLPVLYSCPSPSSELFHTHPNPWFLITY